MLGRWNDVNIALSDIFGVTSLIMQVHPVEEVRAQAEEASQEAHKLATDMSLDRDLFEVLSAIDASALDADAARVLTLSIRDFTRSGVDKDDETRQRLRDLRKSPRHEVHYVAQVDFGDNTPLLSCVIANISEIGAKLTIGPHHVVPEEFTLVYRRRCRVVRREDGQIAVQFVPGH